MKTIVNTIQNHALSQPNKIAIKFLEQDYKTQKQITYQELNHQIDVLSGALAFEQMYKNNEIGIQNPVLLLFDSGIEYITSFLGVINSGNVAVTAYPPRHKRHLERLLKIINNSGAEYILTTSQIKSFCDDNEFHFPGKSQVICVDQLEKISQDEKSQVSVKSDFTAMLQYTSGSTGTPKGVMITHENIISNLDLMADFLSPEIMETCVSWLPIFHDMGLFGNTLLPLYTGNTCVFMAPYTFLKKPIFWMQSFSEHEGTYAMAPNFAYDLCVGALKDQNIEDLSLDLSHIRCLINGAEPIKPQTIRDFEQHFMQYGLCNHVIKPGYGMAETTLCVSVEMDDNCFFKIDKEFFEKGFINDKKINGSSIEMVSCGKVADSYDLKIVDAQTHTAKAPGEVGEIWIRGNSVASGYYQNHDQTNHTFNAHISDDEGSYLRTGDLGFITRDKKLVICGRVKDLLIINGRNIYPQDVEKACYECHPDLIDNAAAAFSIPSDSSEECVIVAEVKEELDDETYQGILADIRRSVFQYLEIIPKDIVLIPPRNIMKTSSGKIQRQACKNRYLKSEFMVIASLEQLEQLEQSTTMMPSEDGQSSKEVVHFLKDWIASQKKVGIQNINIHQAFSEMGLDSIQLVHMVHELEQKTNQTLDPWIVWEYPTIDALSRHFEAEPIHKAEQIDFHQEPIAVIGMDCVLPGKNNENIVGIEHFWENLTQKEDNISPIPQEHWDNRLYFDPDRDKKGRMYCSEGGYLGDIKKFDAKFFNISPKEASYLDPQQRLLLTVTWHALEDAGIQVNNLKNSKTGIYLGLTTHDYDLLIQKNVPLEELNTYQATGTSFSTAAGRLAYFLGTQGPCMAIDTACSSSLVSIHQASLSLQHGECRMAIAGGVNMILSPEGNIIFCKSNMLSPNSRCQTFDESADGYVRSEGCGIVILKRLSDAVKDNDHIYAVINGSAVNQDGASNGLTAPNLGAQLDVMNTALSNANLEPWQVTHIEAHGTGTPLGDPIEWEGIRRVYGFERTNPLNITSLKTRIGHLEAAAGIAGFIKTVLAIQKGKIPAHLNFKKFNPKIKQQDNLIVPVKMVDWVANKKFAGVSSFGFSGTNAHVIIGEAPEVQQTSQKIERPYHLWTISAQSERALQVYIEAYKEQAHQDPSIDFVSQCHHLLTNRTHLTHRAFVVAKDKRNWLKQLEEKAWQQASVLDSNNMVWLFTGQGCMQADVALKIYKTNAQIAAIIDHCCALTKKWLPFDLKEVLLNTPDDVDINHTTYTQPALFVFEFTLATWFLKLGIKPKVLMGHSLGEYVAACLAEVMTLEEALMLVCKRALLFSSLKATGAMLAVSAAETEVAKLIKPIDDLVIALKNGPSQIVVSGTYDAIEVCHKTCRAHNIPSKKIATSHPFHSPLIEPIADEFEKIAQQISYQKPKIPIISNVTGEQIEDETYCAAYFRKHMLETVEFHKGMLFLSENGVDICLEIGPKPLLTMQMQDDLDVQMQSTISDPLDPWPGLLQAIGWLHVRGIDIDWHEYDKNNQFSKAQLLKYPFQTKAYWLPIFESKSDSMSIEDNWKSKLYQERWVDLNWRPARVDSNLSETVAVMSYDKNADVTRMISSINERYPKINVIHLNESTPINKITEQLIKANRVLYHVSTANHTPQKELLFFMNCYQKIFSKLTEKPLIVVTERESVVGKSLFALMGSIKQEYPSWPIKCLDVETGSDENWFDFVLDKEIDFMFLRYLHKNVFQKKILDVIDVQNDSNDSELSSEDVCLITGAYGEIGQVLIEALYELGVKTIIAVGRQSQQPCWSEVIQNKMNEGLRLHYFTCDVSKEQEVKTLLNKKIANLKPVTMVVHAAGAIADKPWLDINHADVDKVIGSKADGAWYLHQHTEKLKLKSFICISSMSAIFGNQGQAVYATANAYLNELISYRLRAGLPAKAYILGPVKNTGFFKQNEESLTAYLTSKGIGPITKDELKYVVKQQINHPRLVISNMLKPIKEIQLVERSEERAEMTSDDETGDIDAGAILKMAQKVLGASSDDLSMQDDWFELGMDSIMAAQLADRINQQVGQKLIKAKDIFSYSTVEKLAPKILNNLQNHQQNQTPKANVSQSQEMTSPLSLQQQEVWRFIQKAEHLEAYHIPVTMQVEGQLSPESLQKAISEVMTKHDILRCSFHDILGQITQHICADCTLDLDIDENHSEKNIESFFKQGFDLSEAPLIKSKLIKIERDKHLWLLSFHHLIADGYTVKSFIHEVFSNYDGKTISKEPPNYFNFISWQWDNVYHALTNDLQDYWFEQLKDTPVTVPVSIKKNQPMVAEVYSKTLPLDNLINSLNHLEKNKLSISNFLLACLFESLMKSFSTSRLGIVVFFSGRDNSNFTEVFGDTSNDVVITSETSSNIFEHTRTIQNQILEIGEKQYFRLDLLNELGLEKPAISFDYQRGVELNLETDFKLHMVKTGNVQNYLWGDEPRLLSFKVLLTDNQLKFAVKFRKDKIKSDTAQDLLDGWLHLINRIESDGQFKTVASQPLLKNFQLSPLQSNLWQLLKNHPNKLPYYIPLFKELHNDIDLGRLNDVLNQAIENTPAFRVSFKKEQRSLVWSLQSKAKIKVQNVSSSNLLETIQNLLIDDIEINSSPLIKAYVINTTEKNKPSIFLLRIHHLICDGLGAEYFLKRLETLYLSSDEHEAKTNEDWKYLAHVNHEKQTYSNQLNQYKKYINHINKQLSKSCWTPSASQEKVYEGQVVYQQIPVELSEKVKEFCQKNQFSQYAFYLHLFCMVISENTNEKTPYISFVKANRMALEDNRMVGYFADNIPALINLNTSEKIVTQIKQTQLHIIDLVETYQQPIHDDDLQKMGYQQPTYLFNHYSLEQEGDIFQTADYLISDILKLSDDKVMFWNYHNPEKLNLLVRGSANGDVLGLIYNPVHVKHNEALHVISSLLKLVKDIV